MNKPIAVMPWQRPDPRKPLKMQEKAAFQRNLLDHCANFDIHSPMSPVVLTTVVCTIGKICMCDEILGAMMDEGMSVARIDMRVGTRREHEDMVLCVRHAVNYFSMKKHRIFPMAIVVDLKGPEILTGALLEEGKIMLKDGDVTILTTHPGWDVKCTKEKIFVDYKNLQFLVQAGDRILLDFGRIELSVRGAVDNDVVCEILCGGELGSYKNVSIPGVPLDIPPVTEKDKVDLSVAIEYSVDAIFASFVRNRDHVQEIRNFLGEKGRRIMLFSKIESKIAYENFDDILDESDGIVVNRAAMSIEFSTEKVMQAQKAMIAKCNKVGKPVFCTSEFLNSMIHKTCPTLAEVSDVATTVIDGADGIILNDETSQGEHPALTVKTLATLCREAEAEVWVNEIFNTLNSFAVPPVDPAHAISIAAVEASLKAHAAAILVVTTSGKSAQLMARYRPRCPVIAITRYGAVARQLNMWRGIIPIHYIAPPQPNWNLDVDMRMEYAIEYGKVKRIIKVGDPLVLVNGWRQGAGFTNNIRFVYASLSDPWELPCPTPQTVG